MKKEAPKFSLFSIPTWVDHKVNSKKVDDRTMENIARRYSAANNSLERQTARDLLKDALIVNDINQNPEDYLREWAKGKHKRNNWAKWLTRLGLGAAGVAGAYGLYQYGIPYIGNLLATKAPGIVSAAKAIFTTDAAAQATSAAPSAENVAKAKEMFEKIAREKPELFAELWSKMGLNMTNTTGSGYRRRKVKRRTKRH